MILIPSAKYVDSELQAEFGKLPPCMLPLGNKRLLEHQISSIRQEFIDEKIVVSLPQSYSIDDLDYLFIQQHDIELIFVPDGFGLAESILYVLNAVKYDFKSIRILHGDTLLYDFPKEMDTIGVGRTSDDYGWELVEKREVDELVWCGFFAFSSAREFIRSLAITRNSLVQAIKIYSDSISIKNSEIEKWYDFGHVNTYFHSRTLITTQRSFNDLSIINGIVKKSGQPPIKIAAEANWFNSIPAHLKKYTPQLISAHTGNDVAFYELEYLHLSPLNEIYVYGANPLFFWKKLFGLVINVLNDFRDECENITLNDEMIREVVALYEQKTMRRLSDFAENNVIDIYCHQ